MTKIDLKTELLNRDGEILIEEGKTITVGKIVKNCLLFPDGQTADEKTTDEEKCRAWFLVTEVNKALKTDDGNFDFEAADIVLVAKQLKRAYPQPLVVGQIKPLLK